MARYNVPRPKKKDFTYSSLTGRWFDEREFNSAVARWESERDEFNARQGAGGAGRVAKAVVSGAITVAGATANPEQSSDTTKENFGQSSLQVERDNNARTQRGATRNKGRGSSGSSRH